MTVVGQGDTRIFRVEFASEGKFAGLRGAVGFSPRYFQQCGTTARFLVSVCKLISLNPSLTHLHCRGRLSHDALVGHT